MKKKKSTYQNKMKNRPKKKNTIGKICAGILIPCALVGAGMAGGYAISNGNSKSNTASVQTQTQNDANVAKIAELNKQILEQAKSINEYKTQIETYKTDTATKLAQIEELTEQLEAEQAKTTANEETITSLNTQIKNLNAQIDSNEASIENLETQLDERMQLLNETQQHYNQLQGEYNQLQEEFSLANANAETLQTMLSGSDGGTLTVPSNVTRIRPYAFAGLNLQSIVLHENIQSIGDHAFENATINEPITINTNYLELGNGVFRNARINVLDINAETLTMQGSLGEGIEGVGGATPEITIATTYLTNEQIDYAGSFASGGNFTFNYNFSTESNVIPAMQGATNYTVNINAQAPMQFETLLRNIQTETLNIKYVDESGSSQQIFMNGLIANNVIANVITYDFENCNVELGVQSLCGEMQVQEVQLLAGNFNIASPMTMPAMGMVNTLKINGNLTIDQYNTIGEQIMAPNQIVNLSGIPHMTLSKWLATGTTKLYTNKAEMDGSLSAYDEMIFELSEYQGA